MLLFCAGLAINIFVIKLMPCRFGGYYTVYIFPAH